MKKDSSNNHHDKDKFKREEFFSSALLIEDDPAHRALILPLLRRVIKEVSSVACLKEGGDFINQKSVDIVISDLMLPDSQGAEIVNVLKSISNNCPILVLTASNRIEDAVSAIKAGASDYIVKSTDDLFDENLINALKNISKSQQKETWQKELINMTSHDLKDPLSTISFSAELLQDSSIPDEKKAILIENISKTAQRGITLIDQFLKEQKESDQSLVLTLKDNVVGDIVRDVIHESFSEAEKRRIKISFNDRTGGAKWLTDGLGLRRVASNIINNAIKYSAKNSEVLVDLYIAEGQLKLSITDFGPGLDPLDLEKLFQPFTRLSQHISIDGTGMGLFTSKKIIEAHKGEISVSSSKGKGTTFFVSIPSNTN